MTRLPDFDDRLRCGAERRGGAAAAAGAVAPARDASGIRVRAVNVGLAAPLDLGGGRTVLSGIRKSPVAAPVMARALGLDGDEQADPSVHGGLQKAVYAYPQEHLGFWRGERQARGLGRIDQDMPPGFMGENLSLEGLPEQQVWVGDALRFEGSDCVLRVTGPREPCGKLGIVMGFAAAGRVMVRSARCGFYLAVDTPGWLAAGMRVQLVPGARALSIPAAVRAKWAKHRS